VRDAATLRRAQLRAFAALCERDFWVAFRRDLAGFLAQALLQPIFYLFIFGRVLPEIGAAGRGYGTQLLPGILALTLFLTSLQNTSLPLVIEFSFTKEIEDRLLAPLPAAMVGVQKVVVAAVRGLVAAGLILPLAALILPHGVDFGDVSWIGFLAVMVAGAVAGAAVGLVLGTAVEARQINVVFAVVLSVGVAGLAALVPGRHARQPADVRVRGSARRGHHRATPGIGLDRARPRRRDAALRRDRRARLRAPRGRLTAPPQPCSSGAIVRPAPASSSQYSSAASLCPLHTTAWPRWWMRSAIA
jgi:hypothetical protein